MTSHTPVQLLSQVPYFAGLDQAQLFTLARTAVPRRYVSGQIVLLQGEPCTGMHLIESGWLRSLKSSPSGREQTLRVVGPGEVYGDFTMFAARPNASSVVALELAQVWFIPAPAVLGLLEQPSFARLVVQTLAGRALQLLSLVEDLSLRTVIARLARLLVENASDFRSVYRSCAPMKVAHNSLQLHTHFATRARAFHRPFTTLRYPVISQQDTLLSHISRERTQRRVTL